MPDDAWRQHRTGGAVSFPHRASGKIKRRHRNPSPDLTMRTDDLDFVLPPELIAQEPPAVRSASRLLHYRLGDQSLWHRAFSDLPSLLRPGDLLVFNDARVIPARFSLMKGTGGRAEGLFLSEESPGVWRVLLKDLGKSIGSTLTFALDDSCRLTIVERIDSGEFRVRVDPPIPASALLERVGRMPLPPYIHRDKVHDERDELDRARYQTVFAKTPGAVAAPTAALHFTPDLLAALDAVGVERAFVTLHVGPGTFKPVSAGALPDHVMHVERYDLSAQAADAINRAKADRRRIVAVGTTSARVLETHPVDHPFVPATGQTNIFIYPPYQWRHVDALITNFHLPRSTLIALVAALTGLEAQRRIYAEAIKHNYRFFSYGDAMLIE